MSENPYEEPKSKIDAQPAEPLADAPRKEKPFPPHPPRSEKSNSLLVNVLRFTSPILILLGGYFGFKAFGSRPNTQSDMEKKVAEIRKRLSEKEGELLTIQTELKTVQQGMDKRSEEKQKPTMVKTAAIEPFDEPFFINTDGESATYRIITVPAEVSGRVIEKTAECRGGSYVKAGTVLFKIDPTDYQLEIDRLKAQRNQSEQELKSNDVERTSNEALLRIAEEDLALQNRQVERTRNLRKKKAATESDLDNVLKQQLSARNSFQTVSNQLNQNAQKAETLKAAIKLIDTQLKKADVNLQRCQVKARTTATVVDDLVEEGNYVKSGDALVHLSDSSRMEIKCNLQADELGWVWRQARMNNGAVAKATAEQRYELPKTPCEVVFDFEGVDIIWTGELNRFEGAGIDSDTRMVPCRVLVTNPSESRLVGSDGRTPDVVPPSLLSGMYVTVRIPIRSPVQLLKVPVEAIRPGGQLWVYRGGKPDTPKTDNEPETDPDKDSHEHPTLHLANVEPVHTEREFALIRQDSVLLEDGDRVIVSPLPAIAEGMPLREASE